MKSIEGEFVKTLRKLREEIEKLERQKASLFEEIEDLRAKAEERANKLRDEVETLQKEVAALKETIATPES